MENKEEQGIGLYRRRSATTSDEFWDRGLEDNPQFPISVAPAIDEIVVPDRFLHLLFPIDRAVSLAPIIHLGLN